MTDCPHCGCNSFGGVGGWHQKKGPLPLLRKRHDLPEWGAPRWVDHPYRLRRDDGQWIYVAEPYDISGDELADLTWLEDNGFAVSIYGEGLHDPGTVAIGITTSQHLVQAKETAR